ncbi:septum formation initiator [Paractinoplanes lichenicola]|uniref:Septum formation initiator n=1 Tax=Paractinoplanes lichenicola TaxID=2802976 RepID=A0ABS1VWK8_9ACTN|nr:septum formation initiator [Actinoplanes lichenicola]MBL7258870.1 septum formation initiator [Actinoplanes lichenicola]
MAPRTLVAGAGWLAAALVATVAGLGGIRLVGDSLTGSNGGVLSQEDVSRALAAATPAPTTAAPTTAAPTSAPSSTRPPALTSFRSAGGVAIAGCVGNEAYLERWSPNPGYEVRDVDEGPDDEARVRFENADRHVDLRITCSGGVPSAREQSNHGGDDDD